MEIERKWMVTGWPAGLEQTSVYNIDQGYILSLIHIYGHQPDGRRRGPDLLFYEAPPRVPPVFHKAAVQPVGAVQGLSLIHI